MLASTPALCQAGFWAFADLTYAYDDVLNGNLTPSISPMQFEDALESWTNYSLLTFTQVVRSASPYIIITYADHNVLGQGTITGDNWTGSTTTLMDDPNYTWAALPF